MLPSRKIYMGITGAALVALGIICISNPLSTVISLAWILGIMTKNCCKPDGSDIIRHAFGLKSNGIM